MNWTELVERVAARADLPKTHARRVLLALGDEVTEALREGDDIHFRPLGTFRTKWREGRTLRSVATYRKMRLDGRYIVQFRPTRTVREKVASRTPQHWKDPQHQAAWRVAETLVADLNLYHAAKAPKIGADADDDDVHDACAEAFGSLWKQTHRTWLGKVPAEVSEASDYLAEAARQRWAS